MTDEQVLTSMQFRKLASLIIDDTRGYAAPDKKLTDRVTSLLRSIWNARGEVDITALETAFEVLPADNTVAHGLIDLLKGFDR